MTERGPITSAHYNVAALKQYLAEQCPGAESYHFVFAKPGEPREAAVHLTCPLTTLFQILIDKQDSGSMVYVEIAPDIFCVPAGVPDIRLDPPVTLPEEDARTIAVLSKDTRMSEWAPAATAASKAEDASTKKRGRPKGGGPKQHSARESAELIPALGEEHRAMLERRGWSQAMIEASGLGTVTDSAELSSLGPRGATPAPYALAIPYARDVDGEPKGRRVQLELPDTGDAAVLARASVWDRATRSPYVPAPVHKDGRLTSNTTDPLVIVFDELDAHVLAELGQRVIGAERIEALKARIDGADTLHPDVSALAPLHGATVVVVGYPAIQGKRMLEARRVGRWLYDAGAAVVIFVGTTQARISECLLDAEVWSTLLAKAAPLDKDTCGEPYTTMRDALPPFISADPIFQDALGMYLPEGYDLDPSDGSLSTVRPAGFANGVEMTKQVLITRSPIIPVARVVTSLVHSPNGSSDEEESIESCVIAHRRDTGWALLHVPMRSLGTKQGVVGLREFGITASEHNAADLIGWFHNVLEVNTLHGRMPTVPRFNALGWHKLLDGSITFAMPHVTPGQYASAPALVTASGPALEGYGIRGGTREGQYKVLRRAAENPALRFAITEVFRSMFVPLLGGNRSRCIHFYGTTTNGKSLGMYIVFNIYGKGQQLEIKGSSTMTGLERQMAARNHTTIYVDDILHKTAEEREALLYMASDGQGKTRATKDVEVRRTVRWVAGLITTGEKPLQDYGMAQGAQARAFELDYAALDQDMINDLADGMQHYGHVIYDWMALAPKVLDLVPKYTAELRALTFTLREEARERGENPRTGDLMAEILVTYRLLGEIGLREELGLPDDDGASLKALLYSADHLQAQVQPEHTDAFEALQSFMLANRNQIVSVDDTSPRQGVVARLAGELLLVEKRWLHKFLQKEGFNSRNVIHKWTAAYVLGSTQRRIADARPKFYTFKAADVLGTQADHQGSYTHAPN